ncbi:hypothetical protein ACFQ60_47970 [Streptomyces zhihengii]
MADDNLLTRCSGVLDLARWRIGSDGIALVAIDRAGAMPSVVVTLGYDADTMASLTSNAFMLECRELQRQLAHPLDIYSWEDVNFADSRFAQESLVPGDFAMGCPCRFAITTERWSGSCMPAPPAL